jgi:plastocyanin
MRKSLVLACLLLTAACSGGGGGAGGTDYGGTPTTPNPPPSGGNTTVEATPTLAFNPSSVTIAAGDSVKWVFGSVSHTVTFQAGATSPGEYGGGGSTGTPPADIDASHDVTVARSFSTPGTYHYRCSIHAGMIGTVTVQ